MPSVDTTTAQVAGSVGHGRPASLYVHGATNTVSPGSAASTGAWIDSPACTWIVFALAGDPRIMSPMMGSHIAFLMVCPSFCVWVAVTIGRVRSDRQSRRGWTRG